MFTLPEFGSVGKSRARRQEASPDSSTLTQTGCTTLCFLECPMQRCIRLND